MLFLATLILNYYRTLLLFVLSFNMALYFFGKTSVLDFFFFFLIDNGKNDYAMAKGTFLPFSGTEQEFWPKAKLSSKLSKNYV